MIREAFESVSSELFGIALPLALFEIPQHQNSKRLTVFAIAFGSTTVILFLGKIIGFPDSIEGIFNLFLMFAFPFGAFGIISRAWVLHLHDRNYKGSLLEMIKPLALVCSVGFVCLWVLFLSMTGQD